MPAANSSVEAGDEDDRVLALVPAQPGRDERPDLVEPERRGEDRAGDHRDLQPGGEAVQRRGEDQLAVLPSSRGNRCEAGTEQYGCLRIARIGS